MKTRVMKSIALSMASLLIAACSGVATLPPPAAPVIGDGSDWAEVSPHVFLRYQRIGNGGHTVVLLHELAAAMENWDEVVPYLSTPQRSVLRYDLRGSGMSSKIRGLVSIEDHAKDLLGLLDHLQIKGPVVLVGDTFGASVALQFASMYPERTAGVMAMGPTAYLDPQPQLIAKFADPLAPGAAPASLAKISDPNDPDAAHKGREREFAAVYPEALRTGGERLSRFYGVQYSTDPTSALLTLRMIYSVGFRDAFSKIRAPVLMTAGSLFLRPVAQFEEMAAAIPGAEFQQMKTAHYAAVESPELVGPAAQQFLARLQQ